MSKESVIRELCGLHLQSLARMKIDHCHHCSNFSCSFAGQSCLLASGDTARSPEEVSLWLSMIDFAFNKGPARQITLRQCASIKTNQSINQSAGNDLASEGSIGRSSGS
jgi:hypothetical protein